MKEIKNWHSVEECIENLGYIQKDITSNKRYVTYNYEMSVLAIIAAYKRIAHRDTFFPIELSDFRNAKQVDGMVLCPQKTELTTIVQVKCLHNKEREFPSFSRKLNGYLYRHYRYLSVANENGEDDINYVIANYDFNLNVTDFSKSEIDACSYNFFSNNDASLHDNHIIRVEKMLQHINYYKDEESYKPTYEWLKLMLNYIYQCSYSEHRCASDCVLNDGMFSISAIRYES